MRTIHKYPLHSDDNYIPVNKGGVILDVQKQDGGFCLWALVDTDEGILHRNIVIYGTGYNIPKGTNLVHLATMQDGPYVWHVFERV